VRQFRCIRQRRRLSRLGGRWRRRISCLLLLGFWLLVGLLFRF